MARPYEDSNSSVKTRRQQEDQRRMAVAQSKTVARSASCSRASVTTRNSTGRHPRLPSETLSQRADLHPFVADKAQERMGYR